MRKLKPRITYMWGMWFCDMVGTAYGTGGAPREAYDNWFRRNGRV